MQCKWDGFRLLVDVDEQRQTGAFTRHGTELSQHLGDLLEPLRELPPRTVLDGELVALAERDGHVVQDFAAVGRATLQRDRAAARSLHYVAFDLLLLDGNDTRGLGWAERDQLLRDSLPVSPRVRVIRTEPASQAAHEAIIALGFEGTVLKRERSAYRPGRQTSWRKVKARHRQSATLRGRGVARDGRPYAVCELADGQRVTASALGVGAASEAGEVVEIVYSRVDAEGGLREARLAPRPPGRSPAAGERLRSRA